MKSVVFWVITRRRVVIIYRCFGTTYQSHLHGSRFQEESWMKTEWKFVGCAPPTESSRLQMFHKFTSVFCKLLSYQTAAANNCSHYHHLSLSFSLSLFFTIPLLKRNGVGTTEKFLWQPKVFIFKKHWCIIKQEVQETQSSCTVTN
jgi:hypothetical protein